MRKILFSFLFLVSVVLFLDVPAQAKDSRLAVPWKPSTLVEGQIGRVTILKDVQLLKNTEGDRFTKSRTLKAGETYRVYSFKYSGKYYYGVGVGYFVEQSPSVKYETPSSVKQNQLKDFAYVDQMLLSQGSKGILNGQPFAVGTEISDLEAFYQKSAEGNEGDTQTLSANNFNYHSSSGITVENALVDSISWEFRYGAQLTPQVIQQRLGKADSDIIRNYDRDHFISYDLGNFHLVFAFQKAGRLEIADSMSLVNEFLYEKFYEYLK